MTFVKFLKPYERKMLKKIKKKGLTITVSGPSGSGKNRVAGMISRILGLGHFSGGLFFRKMAKKVGMSIEQFSKSREKEIDYFLDREILKRGLKGNVVIESRLAGWVLGKHADLKIFVECPLKIRAGRVSKRDKITEKEALKNLKERDRTDREVYKKIYGIDMIDKKIYDVILNNRGSLKDLEKNIMRVLRLRKLV